jgi:hypothetical protein
VAGLADAGSQWPVFSGKDVNAEVYQELLTQHLFPWVQSIYPGKKYVFQQIW